MDIAFYQLKQRPLDRVLPSLVERAYARGQRVAVQATTKRRLDEIDDLLWSTSPESFLPHGAKEAGAPEGQPIYLTLENDNPNGADVRFFIEGARVAPALADPACAPKEKVAVLFEESGVVDAREQWTELLSLGLELVYWAEDETGRFIEKARKKQA